MLPFGDLKSGYMVLLRNRGAGVVPQWFWGMWGEMQSFIRGKFSDVPPSNFDRLLRMKPKGVFRYQAFDRLASRQFIDLVPDSYPSHPEESDLAPPPVSAPATQEPQSISDRVSVPMPVDAPQTVVPEPPQSEFVHKSWVLPEEPQTEQPKPVSAESELAYGPVRQPRRRIHQKDGPMALYRPGPMLQEDFQEMMQEIVPELVNQVLSEEAASDPSHASSSASQPSRGVKRSIDGADDTTAEPADKRPAFDPPDEALFAEPTGQTFACDEMAVCSVELLDKHLVPQASDSLSLEDKKALVRLFREGAPHEVMVAAYMKKKSSKEIPAFGNPPDIQKKVDEAKVLEWGTITAKHAGRPVLGPEADEIRKHLSHRIMGSRFVMTIKHEDGADPRMKARWCLLGHLDPDLTAMQGRDWRSAESHLVSGWSKPSVSADC